MGLRAGGGRNAPAWRYMDFLSFLAIANCLGMYVLWTRHRLWMRYPLVVRGVLVVWVCGCLGGLVFLTERVWTEFIPEADAQQAARLRSARAFMATDDPVVFANEPLADRPVPSVEADVWLFRDRLIRSILPACVREPLRVAPATNADGAFVRNGWLLTEPDAPTEVSWGSYSGRKEAARGTFESQPIREATLPYLEYPGRRRTGPAGFVFGIGRVEKRKGDRGQAAFGAAGDLVERSREVARGAV